MRVTLEQQYLLDKRKQEMKNPTERISEEVTRTIHLLSAIIDSCGGEIELTEEQFINANPKFALFGKRTDRGTIIFSKADQ